jgi:hypothetical protein
VKKAMNHKELQVQILALDPSQLVNAWAYADANPDEISSVIRENEEAMLEDGDD